MVEVSLKKTRHITFSFTYCVRAGVHAPSSAWCQHVIIFGV